MTIQKDSIKLPTMTSPFPGGKDLESLLGIEECLRWYPPNLEAVPDPAAIFANRVSPGIEREIDLFVDVPFCNTICGFCPFNVYSYAKADVAAYLSALQKEIKLIRVLHDFTGTRIRTIWVGGGTPSMLEDGALDSLLALLHDNFDLTRLKEFTVEIKPMLATLTDSKISILRRHAVGRISMGVQSTSAEFLALLGRGQTFEEPLTVIRRLQGAGFVLSIDMMYRLPGQTRDQVAADVDAVRSLGIDHMAWHAYVAHENTPLARKIDLGRVAAQVDRQEYLKMFTTVVERMGEAGYRQYTPYYFTRGEMCERDVGRWRMPQTETLGLGAGAFSFFNGWIYTDEHNPARYRQVVHGGRPPVMRGKQLSTNERITRLAVLGIKFFTIEFDVFHRHSGVRMPEFYERELAFLERLGLIEIANNRVACTLLGKAFNNDVAIVFGTDTSRRTKHPQGVDLMRVKS